MDIVPCPDRIIDDCGGAFIMGAVGSGIWNFFKGYRNTPKRASGFLRSRAKLHGAAQAIRQHAPRTGGAFAVWGFTFSIFDCLISKQRKKEDPFNSILSGALTGGVLSIKQGRRAIITGTIIGGVFLALIEGAGIVMTNEMNRREEHNAVSMSPYGKAAAPQGQAPVALGDAAEYFDEGLDSAEGEFMEFNDSELFADQSRAD